jgi:hypothetical protein
VGLSDHPAHREAEDARPVDPEGVEEPVEVVGVHLERVRSERLLGSAVAARVVREDAVALGERWHLKVPHPAIESERVDQDERRTVPNQVEVQGDPVDEGAQFQTPRGAIACTTRCLPPEL